MQPAVYPIAKCPEVQLPHAGNQQGTDAGVARQHNSMNQLAARIVTQIPIRTIPLGS